VINIAGQGTSTPVDLSGGAVTNQSNIANNFLINYAGTGTIKLSGGTQTYVTVNAPNANVQITGGSDLYGALVRKNGHGHGRHEVPLRQELQAWSAIKRQLQRDRISRRQLLATYSTLDSALHCASCLARFSSEPKKKITASDSSKSVGGYGVGGAVHPKQERALPSRPRSRPRSSAHHRLFRDGPRASNSRTARNPLPLAFELPLFRRPRGA